MKISSVFRLVFGLSITIAMSDACAWVLVYANDTTGKATYGSLLALINAAKQGQDIKVSLTSSNGTTITLCQEIYTGPDFVTCINTNGIGSNVFPGSSFGFDDDTYHAFQMMNTKGQDAYSRWSVGEHTDRGKTLFNRAMKWYVN